MNLRLITVSVCCTYLAVMGSYALVFGETGGQGSIFVWKYDKPNLCSDCVLVDPNENYLGHYQVHILKLGEKPTFYNYNCWGCSISDYQHILDETGLWYYPQYSK